MAQNPSLANFHVFTFDKIYNLNSTQEEVYDTTAKTAVFSVIEGYNATLIAYGQTGTGKTHTMEGFRYNSTDEQRGIIPRSIEDIFNYIANCQNFNSKFMVRASYLQIYNESISDLLKADRTALQIREGGKKGVFVEGLSEWVVRSPREICALMQKGQVARATACTKMNDISSRSHAIFIIILEQMTEDGHGKQIKVGKLNIVDLAGSERVRVTGATGRRLEESKKINQSLSALGNVIAALTDVRKRTHIPYRDSKITRILEDSLGGNCKTTMFAMITPAFESYQESLSTLKFANRAKHIRNAPRINEDVDQKALLRKYESELYRLRGELEARNQNVVDIHRLMELQEEKRQAEADREAAYELLQKQTQDYQRAKEEQKQLQERIKHMDSQMLTGGQKIEETPQFRAALEQKHLAIRNEYESKLQELERERLQIEEDKNQIDRYKQLLLRQRDIMIALTTRLNERDETIIQLQEELEAYDRFNRETEEKLAQSQYECENLRKAMKSHNKPLAVNQNSENRPAQIQENSVSLTRANQRIEELSQIVKNQQETIASLQEKEENGQKGALRTILENNLARPLHNITNSLAKDEYNISNLQRDLAQIMNSTMVSIRICGGEDSRPKEEPKRLIQKSEEPRRFIQREEPKRLIQKEEEPKKFIQREEILMIDEDEEESDSFEESFESDMDECRNRPLTVEEMLQIRRKQMGMQSNALLYQKTFFHY